MYEFDALEGQFTGGRQYFQVNAFIHSSILQSFPPTHLTKHTTKHQKQGCGIVWRKAVKRAGFVGRTLVPRLMGLCFT